MKKLSLAQKIGTGVFTIGVIGASVLSGYLMSNPEVVEVPVVEYVNVSHVEYVDVPVTEYVNVSVENPLNIEMENEIVSLKEDIVLLEKDVKSFEEFLEMAEDRGNNLDLAIFDDAKEVMDNFKQEQKALDKVVDYVESHIGDYLDDEGLVDDEDDVVFRRAEVDYDEYEVSGIDYDDSQFEFEFDVVIKNDGDTETYTVTVEYDDGDIEIIDAQ